MMRTFRIVLLLAVAVLFQITALAQTTTDQATKTPWSANYYQQASGVLYNGYMAGEAAPLQKYDQYTGQGTQAADWEKANLPQNVPSWYGYCQAWSAAAIMLDEPQFSRYGKGIVFRVGDLKGLLMPLYYSTYADMVGQRYWGPPLPSAENDPTPIDFEVFLFRYISGQTTGTKTAVVMDKNPGMSVWNQPLYKYTRTEQKTTTASGWIKKIKMTVEYADEFIDYDRAGVNPATETYYYTLEDTDSNDKADKSQWTNPTWTQPSESHPDFLWYPMMLLPSPNPYVEESDVMAILSLPKVGLLVRDAPVDKGIEPSAGSTWHSPDLWTQPAHPRPTQSVTLFAKVHNESGLDLSGTTVRFYRSAPNLGSMDPSLLGQYKVGEVLNVTIGHYQDTDVSVNWQVPGNVANGDGCILVSVDHAQDPLKDYYPYQDNNVAARNFFESALSSNVSALDFPLVMLNPFRSSARASLRIALDRGGTGWRVALVGPAGQTIAENRLSQGSPVPFANVSVRAESDESYRLRIYPPRNRRIGDAAQISVLSRLVWRDGERRPETNGITLEVTIVAPQDR